MGISLCILAGGGSSEREVSFLSCEEIYANLDKAKYDINIIEIPEDENSLWVKKLIRLEPEIVLSALHGGIGENGAVQGLLECLKIPYVGSKVMSSSISMDKHLSKLIMKNHGVPVIDDIFIKRDEDLVFYEERVRELGFPLVVKPNCGGSSVGISIAGDMEELRQAAELVRGLGDDILIEKYIKGHEVTCGVMETADGVMLLNVLDIGTPNTFYDYDAKYKDDETYIEFSRIAEYQQVMVKEIAKKVFEVLKCAGYGRVDLIIHEEQIYVLEMNTLPGLTSHSLIPKAASERWTFGEFLDLLIDFELGRYEGQGLGALPQTPQAFEKA